MREESWHAIRSTLTATAGPVRIIGNVKGRKNWAFILARKAEAGEPGMAHFRLTAYDAADGLAELKAQGKIPANAKVITREDIEDAKRQLPEHVFAELFLAIPSDDGSNPFGLLHIAACVAERASGPAAAAGWDLAKAQDWTVGIGLNGKGQWCWYERWQGPWEVTIGRIKAVNGETNALVDSTGVGDPIVERLRREAGGQYLPYPFTGPSKQRLMEGLAVAIQQHEITLPDGPVRQELEAFEFEYTRTGVRYSAPENMHDDCVMALALGVQLWSRYGGDMSETDWAMGVWRCECGHGYIWQPGRPCPDCGRQAPQEYPNPAEVEAA